MRHDVRFTARKLETLLTAIEPLVHRTGTPLPPFRLLWLDGPEAAPPLDDAPDGPEWETVEPFDHWGGRDRMFLLRTSFTVPAEFGTGAALYLPLGDAGDFSHPEALLYIDGEPWAACDRHHREIVLPDAVCDGHGHELALHGWTGISGDLAEPPKRDRIMMGECAVAAIDPVLRDFIALSRVALGTANTLDADNPVKDRLLTSLNTAFNTLDLREPLGGGFHSSVPGALEELREGIGGAGAPMDVTVTATGHSHIDVAWLWTLAQTRRKAVRTFHTVLRLMERFPDYHFTQSQPQLYDFVRRDHPALFEAIRERVAGGRWEVIGGMWVEADCNISGPESLARQFLLGRSFFREHFGKDAESPVLWLPDVFGYSWSLPQLIRHAGLEYFFTIKISWNRYNRLPFDSFWWQGIDGSRVLTHFSTAPDYNNPGTFMSTYNASATPRQFMDTWRNFQQKELGHDLLMAFGYGDGGGGPTAEMLENIRELADFPGMPRVRQRDVGVFFRDVEETEGNVLPVWNGELYLEIHRGTYTTQGRNKRANRKCEFLLHDAEFLAAAASVLDPAFAYPAGDLRGAWELVCLNQFHDIIPGSSITPVYAESLEQYAEVAETAETVIGTALDSIAETTGGDLLAINPASFPRNGMVEFDGGIDGAGFTRPDGRPVILQRTADGRVLVDCGNLPPYSVTPLHRTGTPADTDSTLSVTPHSLENDLVRVEIDDAGDIVRILDKRREREVLPYGAKANVFQVFDDRPLEFDAWDVEIYHDDVMRHAGPASGITVVEEGPLRAAVEIRRRILSSDYTQRISLTRSSPRIDIETVIDWRERHAFLKAAFPVDVLSPTATHEIQWGSVERPTHRNTSWDRARFETCAQKWVDLSEGDYGVSILNDCKYGHDVRDNVIRVSLLRGPTSPDPEADLGEHRFTCAIFPHDGPLGEETIAEAYRLNDPVRLHAPDARNSVHQPDASGAGLPFLSVEPSNMVIETVKRAEDGNGIIVRVYESMRRRGRATITAGFDIAAARSENLMEEDGTALNTRGRTVTFPFRPFEIRTIRIIPSG